MNVKSMRIQKTRDDGVIYPVSLTYMQEDVYGKDVVFGDKQIAEHEIYICTGGEAVAYVGENSYPIKRGTILTYTPGEQHRTFVTGLESYERYILLFHYDEAACLWDGIEDSHFAMFSKREAYQKNSIQLMPRDFQQLLFLLERAVGNSGHQLAGREGAFYGDFLKIMRLLSNGFSSSQAQQNTSARVPVVTMALEMIDKQFFKLQRVDEISGYLNVSDSYLARVFKKQVGTSVYEYLLNMKFSHAVKLLAAGKSVTDACFDSGFNSYSHFIQMFKRRYGMTPRKYQKSLDV